jgi:hypothetical protein
MLRKNYILCYLTFYSTAYYVHELNNLGTVLGLIHKCPVLPDLWYVVSLSPVLHCQECLEQYKNLCESWGDISSGLYD